MLIVRAEQFAALDAAMLASFRRRLLAHLRAVLPDHTASRRDDAMSAIVDRSVAYANRYGISTERDVARFAGLMVGLGPDFLELPETRWTHAVIENTLERPSSRLDELYQRLESQFPNLGSLWQAWRT